MVFEKYFIDDTLELNWEYIESIPQFRMLKSCQQNPKWHSEGNAWVHTKMCVEHAYRIIKGDETSVCEEFQVPEDINFRRILIMGVLFHDIGKSETTDFIKGAWHAYGHEFNGERLTRLILWDEDFNAREQVCEMVRYHMEPLKITDNAHPIEAIYKFITGVRSYANVLFVKECDVFGSIQAPTNDTFQDDVKRLSQLSRAMTMMYYNLYPFQYLSDYKRNKIGDGKRQNIFVMIGLPGSGKNTYIDNVLKPLLKDGFVSVSRDDIRVRLGYCNEGEKIIGTKEQENKVTEEFNRELVESVKEGKTVIINNINLKKKYRDAYHSMLKDYKNLNWVYVYVEAPTLKDNIKRREGDIPGAQFPMMISNFDFPTSDEYYDLIIEKQHKD